MYIYIYIHRYIYIIIRHYTPVSFLSGVLAINLILMEYHSINDISYVIFNGISTATADRQLYEQKLMQGIATYKCGLIREFCFVSKYAFFNRS